MADSNAAIAAERFVRLGKLPFRSVGAVGKLTPKSIAQSYRDIWDHRDMLGLLTRRDLKAKYKDSALGFLWALARPLMQLAIYYVVLGKFIGAARGIDDFAIFIFAGLAGMTLFQEIAVGGTSSILANAGLVKKVYMPRELFPLATAGSAIFNFGVQLIVLFAATLLVGKPPFHAGIIYFIPSVLVIIVYGVAFGLFFGALNVYLRDIGYLVEVGMMLVFWASPVVYSWKMVADLLKPGLLLEIYTNNPLTLAVIGMQRSFWVAGDGTHTPGDLMLRLIIALLVGLVLLVISHRVFLRLQGNFAQEL